MIRIAYSKATVIRKQNLLLNPNISTRTIICNLVLDEGYYEVDKSINANPSIEEFHFEDEVVFVCHPGKLADV